MSEQNRRSEAAIPDAYPGYERRASKNISREEFNTFAITSREWRNGVSHRLEEINERLEKGDAVFAKLLTALFAPDDDNENKQPGLMTTAQHLEAHIAAVCKITKWVRNGILAICALIVSVAGAAKAMGVF